MSDPKEKSEMKLEIPNSLPEGFAPVEPHINHQSNKFTINLTNGSSYPITSDAKRPKDLFERLFAPDDAVGAVPRKTVTTIKAGDGLSPETTSVVFYLFPEAVVQISSSTLEAIEAGWTLEESDLDLDEDEDEDDEDEKPRKKPKKPW